ncbi:MAG: translation initiation factor IF-3 [Chloroflexota bacterium]
MRRGRNFRSSQQQTSEYRVNRQIRVREVRLIDHEGNNRGVIDINEARDIASDAELDLVEVAPNANPPVCRVMDYGKFSYEKAKREKEARKHQKQIEIKTIKLTPRTSDYHKDIYIRKARNWLEDGKKVKFQVRFKAREITYPEIGQETLEDIAKALEGDAAVEQMPKLEGWSMTMMLTPETSTS